MGLLTVRRVPAPRVTARSLAWFDEVPAVEPQSYLAAAERVAAGRLDLFSLADVPLGPEPDWNRDPKSGRRAPLVFGRTLDVRDERLVGDIRYLWEPNRHLHLVVLAQAWRLSGRERYLAALRRQLDSWLRQCPYLLGPNWSRPLEAGIRLINWAIVWQLCEGAEGALFAGAAGARLRERLLEAVYRQAHFIRGYLSRHACADNRLIGEAAALAIAGTVWPFWPVLVRWAEEGHTIVASEALRQSSPDGVGRAQTTAGQQFVLDCLLLVGLCRHAAGHAFPGAFWRRIEAMLEFLAAVMDVNGRVPRIGETDDGCVVRLVADERFCPYRSLLATGAVLYERPEFKAKAGGLDDKTRWLLGDEARERYARLRRPGGPLPLPRAFTEGGHYILGERLDTPQEVRMLVDAAPLGHPGAATHGHADALAIVLSVAGREILVDPGAYANHSEPHWRTYFRGTAAHNTLRVDGLNQAVGGGDFAWRRHVQACCEHWHSGEGETVFSGSHDGYLRLPDPLLHRRRIQLYRAERRFRIDDTLEAAGDHDIERFWHFSAQCRVRLDGAVIVVENDGVRVRLVPGEAVEARLLFGSEVPLGGWIARRFDTREPAPTVVWRCRIAGTARLRTEILCGERTAAGGKATAPKRENGGFPLRMALTGSTKLDG